MCDSDWSRDSTFTKSCQSWYKLKHINATSHWKSAHQIQFPHAETRSEQNERSTDSLWLGWITPNLCYCHSRPGCKQHPVCLSVWQHLFICVDLWVEAWHYHTLSVNLWGPCTSVRFCTPAVVRNKNSPGRHSDINQSNLCHYQHQDHHYLSNYISYRSMFFIVTCTSKLPSPQVETKGMFSAFLLMYK